MTIPDRMGQALNIKVGGGWERCIHSGAKIPSLPMRNKKKALNYIQYNT